MTCSHGVEAGNYCAKCGREVVSGPRVEPIGAGIKVTVNLAGVRAGTCRCSRCGRESSVASKGDVCGDLTAKGNPCHGKFR